MAVRATMAALISRLRGMISDPTGTSDAQTVAITGSPTGGTFTLTWNGQVTSAIAYNASAATVQAALLSLAGIPALTVAGGPGPSTAWTVTFTAAGPQSVLVGTSSLTGGTIPGVAVTHATLGTTQIFADQDIQDVLDFRRMDVYNAVLRPVATLNTGGVYSWLDYYSDLSDWEDDIVLKDRTFTVLAPATTDNLVGHWTFPASNSPGNLGQLPPVYVGGKTYDLNAASADLLERWCAKVKLDFDFGMGRGDNFARSQKAKMLLEMAKVYRSRARVMQISVGRSDIQGGISFNPTGV